MCVNRLILPSGVEIACRKCWQCTENYISDWVGRCIAEAETAAATNSVTLTYRPEYEAVAVDDPESPFEGARIGSTDRNFKAQVLCYSDVQRFLKRLRFNGFPCRYVVAGEYGSMKGRAHWHVILFWKDAVPKHEDRVPFLEPHWPHGHSFWDESSVGALRYVVKYIRKAQRDASSQCEFHMSKFPPLGSAYFAELAGRYVDQGLAPQDASYSFPEVKNRNGKTVKFWLHRQSLDGFLRSFLHQWAERRGGHPPSSQLLEDWCDKQASSVVDMDWRPRPFVSQSARVTAAPFFLPQEGANVEFSESHNAFFAIVNGERLWWSFDEKGERAWRRNLIIPEAAAPRLGAEFSRKNDPLFYRKARDPG